MQKNQHVVINDYPFNETLLTSKLSKRTPDIRDKSDEHGFSGLWSLTDRRQLPHGKTYLSKSKIPTIISCSLLYSDLKMASPPAVRIKATGHARKCFGFQFTQFFVLKDFKAIFVREVFHATIIRTVDTVVQIRSIANHPASCKRKESAIFF